MPPVIGGHVSAAGGVSNAVERGVNIGASTIMFFGASPRQFTAKLPPMEEILLFRKKFKEAGLHSAFLHAAYLINLGSTKEWSRKGSVRLLQTHFEIATALHANGLIVHVGSAGDGNDMQEALKYSAEGIKQVLKAVPGKTQLIMENAAGGGTKIGSTPEQLGTIMKLVKSPRLKVCIDTAHSFEAGLLDYTPKGIQQFFDSWEKACGKGSVVVLHANDSKTEFQSLHDRHENIGKGYIGLKGFQNLVKDPRVKNLPWLLEVPGYANEGPDKKNVDILRKAVKGK
jgi:deoxyribonuclease-4